MDNKKIIDQLYDDCYTLSFKICENVGDYWDDDLRRAYDKLMETVDIISINVSANTPTIIESCDGLNHNQWIPCSEKLPEEYEVLCCDIYKDMIVGHPYKDEESDTGFFAEGEDAILCDCIAWMPLPEPYKKEEDKNV